MIRRRKPVETKVNHDRWLVSYADFITLLFAFFVVMYSISQVNETQYRELSETLSATFKSRTGAVPATPNSSTSSDVRLANIGELSEQIKSVLHELVEAGHVNVQATDEWVEISVNANLLFASASSDPSDEAKHVFTEVSALLAPYDNAIEVSGHTDDRPISNQQFKNNWELSAARATSVVKLLSEQGVAPERLAATGYGEFRPVADNTTEEGRTENRRVVLMIARHQAERSRVTPDALPETLDDGPASELESDASEELKDSPTVGEGSVEQQSAEAGVRSDDGSGENREATKAIKPIIREDGSLLFTNDPDLPRQNTN